LGAPKLRWVSAVCNKAVSENEYPSVPVSAENFAT